MAFDDLPRHLREGWGGLGAVYIGEDRVVARVLESVGDESRFGQVVEHDTAIARKAEVDDWTSATGWHYHGSDRLTVEHLGKDGVRRAREVQVVRVVGLAEVVQLKDEVLGQELRAAPDDPSDTDGTYRSVS